jgi:hypothetical protein
MKTKETYKKKTIKSNAIGDILKRLVRNTVPDAINADMPCP